MDCNLQDLQEWPEHAVRRLWGMIRAEAVRDRAYCFGRRIGALAKVRRIGTGEKLNGSICPRCGGKQRLVVSEWAGLLWYCDKCSYGQVATKPGTELQRVAWREVNKKRQGYSQLEEILYLQIAAEGLPMPDRQYKFLPDRKFRADFAWPSRKLIVEVQGAEHRIKGRWQGDVERMNLLQLEGWTVLQFTGKMVRNGTAVQTLRKVLRREA